MSHARRVDANQAAITDAFRKCGWLVHDMSGTGGGFPDLIVGKPGKDGRVQQDTMRLVEVKDGKKPPSARTLTPPQEAFHARWPVVRVMSVDDALGMMRDLGLR